MVCCRWSLDDLIAGEVSPWNPCPPLAVWLLASVFTGAYGFVCGWVVGCIAGRLEHRRVVVLASIALGLAILPVIALTHDDPPLRDNFSACSALVDLPVLAGVLLLERITRRTPLLPRATWRRTRSPAR
jgi:hypothetical protein